MTVTLTISGKPDDEGSGIVVLDSSGCGNNGTIYEATWVKGTSRQHE